LPPLAVAVPPPEPPLALLLAAPPVEDPAGRLAPEQAAHVSSKAPTGKTRRQEGVGRGRATRSYYLARRPRHVQSVPPRGPSRAQRLQRKFATRTGHEFAGWSRLAPCNAILTVTSERKVPMDLRTDVQKEGPIARAIEKQTSRVPSDVFLWGALGSIALSLALGVARQGKAANFVGQWVPTLLLLGVYNKIVKVSGHDVHEHAVH